jgi:molybdenum cofactor biosynthesis protein B
MSVAEHKSYAPSSVGCYVLTVSDTRTTQTDTGGGAIRDLLANSGHTVTASDIVRDDPAAVLAKVRERLEDPDTHVIITTGGTGISSRDSTYEAIDGLLEKQLTGFGELFRMLSFQEIGVRRDDVSSNRRAPSAARRSSSCRAPLTPFVWR